MRVVITLHAQPLAVDPPTYDLYLAAREASFRVTDEAGMLAAFETFQRVVGAAPVFARAWAELARTGSLLWRYHDHGLFPQLTCEVIAHAAHTALKLDPGLGIAYLALSELERFDHFVERGVLHGQALTYAPGDAAVLAGAAMFRSEVGRLGEAVELAAQAARIDPMFGVAEGLYAGLLTGVGRHAEAQAVLDRLLAAKPDSPSRTHNALYDAACAADWDRFDDLVTQAKLNGAYDKDIAEYVTYWTAIRTDDWVAMQRYLHQIAAEFAPGRLGQNDAIQNAVALGDVELAFDFVQRYALEHDESRLPTARFFSFAGTMFMWGNRPMMRDIRFIQLCHKIGLCNYWVETGNWPDCAGEGRLPYDFKAECRRLAAE
jgi:tetratricopeptide (TPR) repeat protein